MSRRRPDGVRGNLRLDLVGEELKLDDTDTRDLDTGQTTAVQIVGVYDADDREEVRVVGRSLDPGAFGIPVELRVKATSLPAHSPDVPRRAVDL